MTAFGARGARAAAVALVAAGAALLGGVGTARADFTETFCSGGSVAAPWSGPAAGTFAGEVDGCGTGAGYQFLLSSDIQPGGTSVGSTIQLPAGEVLTGLDMDFSSRNTESGTEYLYIGYATGSDETTVAYHLIGSQSGSSVQTAVPDATSVFTSAFCIPAGDCEFISQNILSTDAIALTLHDTTSPSVTGQGGSLLGRGIRRGAQTVGYTASAGGSGVARVTLSLGSTVVATATSTCQAAALAPCPPTTSGTFDVNTGAVPDGRDAVVLTAYNASGDATSADLGTVTVRNHSGTITLAPALRRLHVRLALGWTWSRARTTLAHVSVTRLRGRERIAVSCAGRRCPFHTRATGSRELRRFLRAVRGARFAPGDRVAVALTAPHRRSERARLLIRSGRIPRVIRSSRSG